MPNGTPATPASPSYPASRPMPYAAPAPAAAPREPPSRLHPAWAIALLVGAALVALSPLMNLGDTIDGMEGDDKAAYIFAVIGRGVLGLALLGAGAWSTRASWGARAALLIAGGYFLLQGTIQSLFSSIFGGFGDEFF